MIALVHHPVIRSNECFSLCLTWFDAQIIFLFTLEFILFQHGMELKVNTMRSGTVWWMKGLQYSRVETLSLQLGSIVDIDSKRAGVSHSMRHHLIPWDISSPTLVHRYDCSLILVHPLFSTSWSIPCLREEDTLEAYMCLRTLRGWCVWTASIQTPLSAEMESLQLDAQLQRVRP